MTHIEETIHTRLTEHFNPDHLVIENESAKHHGHKNNPGGYDTHFKITMTSKAFKGISRMECHRLVLSVLKDLMNNPIHALSLGLS
jgi:BolA protein